MPDKKIAIVCSGGGMKCAYSAGVLVALAKELNLVSPDLIIAASGSAGSVFYYLAKQYEEIERIWTKHLAKGNFISFLRFWKIIDIDYLIDTVFRNLEPLDDKKIKDTTTKLFIPLININTKSIVWAENHSSMNTFEMLRAAKALPFFYGKEVALDKNNHVDGAFIINIDDMIRKAASLGATHLIVIDNHVQTGIFKIIKRLWQMIFFSKLQKPDIKISTLDIMTVILTRKFHWKNFFTESKTELKKIFDAGYSDTVNNPAILEILRSYRQN